jgi:hypothetical protein
MAPVLLLLALLFAYSLVAVGGFASQAWQRRRSRANYRVFIGKQSEKTAFRCPGYPLASLASNNPGVTRDELDMAALEQLEGVRLVSRVAPMLGLIATMIPMGPALQSLADGDVQGISENLIVAFSAVIFGLVIASITFWISSVKKRWLAAELVAVSPLLSESLGGGKEDDLREAA